MLKSEIHQKLQNILSEASAVQNLLACQDVDDIVDGTVLCTIFDHLDGIARVSTGAMNDITLSSAEVDMCQTILERY